jgi:hypothetical protein
MPSQHFFVQGRYLGSRQVPRFSTSSTFGARVTWTTCLFCPECADIWARLIVEDAGYSQCWPERCPKHGGGELDRTCRFEWWPCELEADWPEEALRYVLLRELKLFEQRMMK